MAKQQFFLDTAYFQALLDQRDQYHAQALRYENIGFNNSIAWTTEAVIIEIGDGLSRINRTAALGIIEQCYNTSNVTVITLDKLLIRRGLQLYRARSDKTWGLTDCISFVVMQDLNLTEALTADQHFVQAGFRALLREK